MSNHNDDDENSDPLYALLDNFLCPGTALVIVLLCLSSMCAVGLGFWLFYQAYGVYF